MEFITAQGKTPAPVGHVDKSNYITIWSSDIIKCHWCTVHHKSDKTWLRGHSLSHLITGSLACLITLSFLLSSFPPHPPVFIHTLASYPPSLIINLLLLYPLFIPFLITLSPPPRFLYFFFLHLASFIHSCHFVCGFPLCFSVSKSPASSLPLLSHCDSLLLSLPLMIHSFTHFWVFSSFFLPTFPYLTPIILPHHPVFLLYSPPPHLYIFQCLSPSSHSLWAMALLILSVMILPKDNHEAKNLFNLPGCLHVQCVCVCVYGVSLTLRSHP